jgi:uncharacterized protein (DUF488 family)
MYGRPCAPSIAGAACGAYLAKMARTLFTIGYERLSLPLLVEALQAAKVKMLIDVRELPNSRRAGFSKRVLASTLDEAGIGYTHLKALGTPKAGREAGKAGRMAAFWDIVDGALARPEALMAMEQAAEIAGKQTACLLCLEHDHKICHRSRVAETLAARGFKVRHLEPDG